MYRPRPIARTPLPRASILPSLLMLGGSVIGVGAYIKSTVLLKQYGKKIQLHGKWNSLLILPSWSSSTLLRVPGRQQRTYCRSDALGASNDGPVEPSVELEDMVIKVCDDLGESISEHTVVRPVLIPGTHTIHAGTLGTMQGGLIGLPSFFEFNKVEEIDGKIQWNETSATNIKEIYNAFMLSEEAKKYAIAREILLVNTPEVYINIVVPVAIPFLIDKFATHASIQSEIAKLPSNARSTFYVLICILGIVIWRSFRMKLQRYYENKAECNISKLGEDYIRGAVEYNTKTVQRNLCSATIKDQNNRVLKNISDKIKFLFSSEVRPSSKVQFYKSLTISEDKIKNNM